MFQTPSIRKAISAMLLLVFLISAAPKAYFHDVVADHKDQAVNCNHKKTDAACVHQNHINCHFDQLVVSSFFQFESVNFFATAPANLTGDYTFYAEHSLTGRHSSPDGRGPPAV